jgi:signal transduction histidine kinase/ActR/RegA family two-component response regulator/sensor domain CHASE-containing protein
VTSDRRRSLLLLAPHSPLAEASRTPPRAPSVRRLLTRFSLVAFLTVGAVLGLGKLAVDAVIARVEREETHDAMTRTRAAFDRLARRALQQVSDYAFWDETVRLARVPALSEEAGFFRRNFEHWLPRDDYEFIVLFDGVRKPVFEWTAVGGATIPSVATSPRLLDQLKQSGALGGFIRDAGRLYLVGGAPMTSGTDAASRGYLVVGRLISASLLDSIAIARQLTLRALPAESSYRTDLPAGESFAKGDSVRMFFPLIGVTGERVAVIEVLDERSELHRISQWTTIGAFMAIVFAGVVTLLVWLYGRRLLIEPLSSISVEIDDMHRKGELAEVASAPPSAEWALFVETFNETVRSLRDSEQRYRTLFDHSADPYLLLDAETRDVVDANPAAIELLGEAPSRLVGGPLPDRLQPTTGQSDLVRVRRQDGTLLTWGLVETDFTIGVRRLTLVAYRDLTDREALAQSQKMEAIGSLAGGIAHDFNNLMGAVLAGVDVARRAMPNDRRAEAALDAISHAGTRAAELTSQLLGVTAREPLRRIPVNVTAAVTSTEQICAATFDRRIRIVTEIEGALPAIEGDAGQLEQALLNLCINARDAMSTGGTLTITARRTTLDAQSAVGVRDVAPGDYVVVSVADDGHGMNEEVKQRIFEPFFTTKERGKGTGLGLAMVFGFARNVGGTVAVDSSPGRGARFDLYLRASTLPPAPVVPRRTTGSTAIRDTRDKAPLILLVDDEAGLREMLRMVLEFEGFAVREAENGADAVRCVRDDGASIAAVLLDVQMPVMNGVDAYARIRAIAPGLPIVLGTGFVGDAELDALRATGADDLLTKPYDIPALIARLHRLAAAARLPV